MGSAAEGSSATSNAAHGGRGAAAEGSSATINAAHGPNIKRAPANAGNEVDQISKGHPPMRAPYIPKGGSTEFSLFKLLKAITESIPSLLRPLSFSSLVGSHHQKGVELHILELSLFGKNNSRQRNPCHVDPLFWGKRHNVILGGLGLTVGGVSALGGDFGVLKWVGGGLVGG